MTGLLCVLGALAFAALVTRKKPGPLELPARDSGVLDAGALCRLGQRTETGAGIVTGQRARSR
jgi:hypothetical protein